MTGILLLGTQIAMLISLSAGPFHLEYAGGTYVADRPVLYPTSQWELTTAADLYVGVAGRRIDTGFVRVAWTVPIVGVRTPSLALGYHLDGGFDWRISARISPDVTVGYYDARWFALMDATIRTASGRGLLSR